MSWSLTRRQLLEAGFTTLAVGAAGVPLRVLPAEATGWTWDKSVCRFCGTGCGIQIATQDGRVVAVKGDPASPVNRGLLCAKGYACAQILYGQDRLTRPLLRKRGGVFHKQGDFEEVSWEEAFDVMKREWTRAHARPDPRLRWMSSAGAGERARWPLGAGRPAASAAGRFVLSARNEEGAACGPVVQVTA